jgi:transposase-like protein
MPIITRKIAPDSIVYTDSYPSYNALDVSDFSHHRINHSENLLRIRIISMVWKISGIKRKRY